MQVPFIMQATFSTTETFSLSCLLRSPRILVCFAILAMAPLLWGCAAKGFIKNDRFINNRFGFTFPVPEGWSRADCLPEAVQPVLKSARFKNLHPLLLLSDSSQTGRLQVSAGRSLYSYNLYTSHLFGGRPEIPSTDYTPGLTRSDHAPKTATREGDATDAVAVREEWGNHFKAFQTLAGKSDEILAYTRYNQEYGSHPGFHEQWIVSSKDIRYRIRRETLFFRCRADDTCFAAFTLISPPEATEASAEGLETILAAFERFFPFERPY